MKIRRIHLRRKHDLFIVVQILGLHGAVFCLRQRWQEHGREDCDDGNHDQQFNERECAFGEVTEEELIDLVKLPELLRNLMS
jgi:hypothetical protein